jgi:hypothetical protein
VRFSVGFPTRLEELEDAAVLLRQRVRHLMRV